MIEKAKTADSEVKLFWWGELSRIVDKEGNDQLEARFTEWALQFAQNTTVFNTVYY